jgi:hypothetical protein
MKFSIKILTIICITFFFSCASDSSSSKVRDDFSYLSVTPLGRIEKIGNNSGKISFFSQVEGLNQGTFNLNIITCNSEKIFLVNHITTNDKLYVFDRITKKTISKELIFPKEIVGNEPSISAVIWDESKKMLYAIIASSPYINYANNFCYFIKINPNTLEISYEGLTIQQSAPSTTFLNAGKLYSSLTDENAIEIDLDNNTSKTMLFNNSKISFMRAAAYTNNTAYCLINKIDRSVELAKINLIDNSFEDLLPSESFGLTNKTGKGFINYSNNEYVCYLIKNNSSGLLKYNITTKKYTFLKLTSDNNLDEDFLIIDKIDN